jgi:hypothetical protein
MRQVCEGARVDVSAALGGAQASTVDRLAPLALACQAGAIGYFARWDIRAGRLCWGSGIPVGCSGCD